MKYKTETWARLAKVSLFVIAGVIAAMAIAHLSPQYVHYVVLLMAASLLTFGARRFHISSKPKNWLASDATITSISEESEEVIMLYSAVRYYYPLVTYKYSYGGDEYASNLVALDKKDIMVPEIDNWGTRMGDDKKFWHDWKIGDVITVYVNPDSPANSVIIVKAVTSSKSQDIAMMLGGLILFLVWYWLSPYNYLNP
jgi:hypothetical protein